MRGADRGLIRRSARPGLRKVAAVTRARVAALVQQDFGAVQLHVLPKGTRVRVTLVAASDLTHVGFVAGVHVGMLLPVAAVGEPAAAALEVTFKRLLTYKRETGESGDRLRPEEGRLRGSSAAHTFKVSQRTHRTR